MTMGWSFNVRWMQFKQVNTFHVLVVAPRPSWLGKTGFGSHTPGERAGILDVVSTHAQADTTGRSSHAIHP